jgi:hypothetical protein
VSFSAGIAQYVPDRFDGRPVDTDTLVHIADRRLYLGKALGRAVVVSADVD